ncbi:serine/threonine-protein phosphatase [Actinomyces bowdenii]|uniref:Serine/threonine-protein phosphatase n=1 Tax=Actinomyces bowdenii TaxID=131109 RepID=A0A3P1VCD2_9ACTO|nr:protein phosphatase 2C domain-containing protein [Actinomyces bowdenii]MBO3723473.1 serine/threonine-protein phosphatase [Actinomyces bowdenii]RRD31035.1 serine/threonine-protein phosphatase [Actinomyces bowdenii]
MSAGAATDVGRLRTVNEDGYLAVNPAFVVVDGMGGHAAGQAAAQAALEELYALAGATITSIDPILGAVSAAQESIIAIPSHAAFLPGATIAGVIMALLGPQGSEPAAQEAPARPTWLVFNIGDARVYLLRDNIMSQITRDHSQVQVLIDTGQLTPEQARHDPRRNVVTRALGGGIADSAIPDLYSVPVQAGDRMLVCSDGLSDELDDDALATILAAGFPPQRTAELLVAASLEEGGHDNSTAVVVDALAADGSAQVPA